ncbi:unnamed protein product, partial [marine sediment metagenome]
RYLGKKGKLVLEFATVFGIYAAIIAYILGIGKSLSFLFFKNSSYTVLIGLLVGFIMSYLIWRGFRALKKYEKIGVSVILFLLIVIFFIFIKDVNPANLYYFNIGNVFLPFGVVLFALMSFHAVPELQMVLHKNEKLMKKALIIGTLIPIIFYILFAFVVVGFKGFVVIRPWGAQTIENMYGLYEEEMQKTGHKPTMMPTVIPEENLKKESSHIKGFTPEVFWLQKIKGDKKLALRPTSETLYTPMFALWVRSHRDLPLKLYQRGSVFRCDTKATRPLIRSREIIWIEG